MFLKENKANGLNGRAQNLFALVDSTLRRTIDK